MALRGAYDRGRNRQAGEQSEDWVCTGCGRNYRAVFLKSWPPEFRRNVRPEGSQPEQSELPTSPKVSWDRVAESDAHQPHPISIAFPGHREIRCGLETSLSRQFDAKIDNGVDLTVHLHGDPFADAIRKHGENLYEERAMSHCIEVMHQSAEQLGELFTCLTAEQSADVSVTESISRNVLLRATEDLDLFVSMGLAPSSASYPSQHALRVAMLAMSTGATLGWDEQAILDLGVGCLVHDVGMLGVERKAYESKQILSASPSAGYGSLPRARKDPTRHEARSFRRHRSPRAPNHRVAFPHRLLRDAERRTGGKGNSFQGRSVRSTAYRSLEPFQSVRETTCG